MTEEENDHKYSFAPAGVKQALFLKSDASIIVYGGGHKRLR